MDLVITLMGPSGVGKDTIIDELKNEVPVEVCKRATTRKPRVNDPTDLLNYHFLSYEKFMEELNRGAYVMPNRYADAWYGVPISEIYRVIESGRIPIIKGTLNVLPGTMKQLSGQIDFFNIYLYPPSLDSLENRLNKRGSESPELIGKRFKEAIWEIKAAHNGHGKFIHSHVINYDDHPEDATEQIVSNIKNQLLARSN
ncbi:MAG: Guanylate kinase [uncultured bacterium]|nr:MAG: Guanylate kinase [uncultured bacterium]